MRKPPVATLALLTLLSASSALALTRSHRAVRVRVSLHSVSLHHRLIRTVATHHEPVRAMDPDRATAIQAALIRDGYLTGEPSGNWDAASVAAMQKLQSENGWQTKLTPDSRALIKLGLGPQSTAAAAAAPPVQ